MFTGIIAEQGKVLSVERDGEAHATVRLRAPGTTEGLTLGGSIAVNGVCLTATAIDGKEFSVDVMGETLVRSTIGDLTSGDSVNLERCVPAGGRLDGHVVQGHVDGVGQLLEREELGNWERLRFRVPEQLARYIAEKGSIAIDGVSLTVTAVSSASESEQWFEVGLIPTTLAETGLGAKSSGSRVNLEVDVLAKYTERLMSFTSRTPGLDPATLQPQQLDPIAAAVRALAAGRAVVVVDSEDRENEGDIIFAAQHATPELMGWTIRYSSGVICVPLDGERADALALPPMTAVNEDAKGTAYTVSCDAATGISTGISATDRALTARVLADPGSGPASVTRPGHIFPLRAVDGGVRERPGHTEAAVDLCRLAGVEPVGVIAELVYDDGEMMRLDGLRRFAKEHDCPLISIEDLVAYLEADPVEKEDGK